MKEKIKAAREAGHHKIRIAVTDIDGVLRGKYISLDKLEAMDDLSFGFCNVIFGWDINDAVYDQSEKTGWQYGYPDALATLDASTWRTIPWQAGVPSMLGDLSNDPNLASICPRTLLKTILAAYEKMGIYPKVGPEYEWFNFNERPDTLTSKPKPLTPGMFGYSLLRTSMHYDFVDDLFEVCKLYDIGLEGLHTETGDGVYEAAIAYDDALKAADKAILFKSTVKEIAYRHDIMASFMAKWNPNLPGCGGHMHITLHDSQGNNLLEPNRKESAELRDQFTAGMLATLPHLMPMYAPIINSYKRYVEGSWAATSVSWGHENRTTAVRYIEKKENTRIEMRVPGADANPYLAMAAALAGGLYGINNHLQAPKAIQGNAYLENLQKLPNNLQDATEKMASSQIAPELLGKDFVQHFITTRRWEVSQYQKAVTDWEINRYFELI